MADSKQAKVVYVNIEPHRFNDGQTQMSIGFEIDGETKWMRYVVAGGTKGQQDFAAMQLSKLLKAGGPYKVNVETNERGYEDVYADDGFRKGGNNSAADERDDEGF